MSKENLYRIQQLNWGWIAVMLKTGQNSIIKIN